MKHLNEEDFAALRIPFESGRQSPNSLGGSLLLSIPLHVLIFVLIYMTVGYHAVFPYKEVLLYVHATITAIVLILSFIYSFSAVYMKGQKMQYLMTIIVSQLLFSFDFFLAGLFTIGSEGRRVLTEADITKIMIILILLGVVLFVLTFIRFYHLLKKGQYRAGTGRDIWRSKVEATPLMFYFIVNATSISLIVNSVDFTLIGFDFDMLFFLAICSFLYFTMIFVLPEQLVLLYCKRRFKSFNYDQAGNLIEPPAGSEKVEKDG